MSCTLVKRNAIGVAVLVAIVLLSATVATVESGVIETNETSDSDYYGVKIYPIARNCAMVGGICVHKVDCKERTSTDGLCGKSQHMGVECCYSVVPQPTTCQKLMGACMSRCNPSLVQDLATDCPADQQCCVLV